MKHVDDIELIEYVAGNLTESEAAAVHEHITACDKCSQRVQEAARLSDTLGLWEVETSGHNVGDRVIALAQQSQPESVQRPATHARIKRLLPQMLRVAASIIIAVGLGHKLGEYSVTGKKPPTASSQSQPEYLAALGLQWSSELAWLVLEDDPAETGAEQ
jgi:anti-sigma factor RsiW